MTDKTISNIIETLIEKTKEDSIIWSLAKNIFNSETEKYYQTILPDDKTIIKLQISMDDKFNIRYINSLIIDNPNLVNGSKYVSERDSKGIAILSNLIYQKYVIPLIPSKNEPLELNNILLTLSGKDVMRDKKIESILSESSFFKKVFGK